MATEAQMQEVANAIINLQQEMGCSRSSSSSCSNSEPEHNPLEEENLREVTRWKSS